MKRRDTKLAIARLWCRVRVFVRPARPWHVRWCFGKWRVYEFDRQIDAFASWESAMRLAITRAGGDWPPIPGAIPIPPKVGTNAVLLQSERQPLRAAPDL